MTGSRRGHDIEVVGATPESEALSSVFAKCGVRVGKVPRGLLRAETPPGTGLTSLSSIHPLQNSTALHSLALSMSLSPICPLEVHTDTFQDSPVAWGAVTGTYGVLVLTHTAQTERKPSKTQAGLDIPRIPLIGEFSLSAASLKVKSSEICARKSRPCKF